MITNDRLKIAAVLGWLIAFIFIGQYFSLKGHLNEIGHAAYKFLNSEIDGVRAADRLKPNSLSFYKVGDNVVGCGMFGGEKTP